MERKLYLEGELGAKFGTGFPIRASSPAEALRCLDANLGDSFRAYLINAHEKGINFVIDIAGDSIQEEELNMPISTGDITITPLPAGSKSGGAKILGAIALVVAAIYAPQLLTYSGSLGGQTVTVQGSLSAALSGAMGTGVQMTAFTALSVATNLAIMGIQQLMMPDPSTDKDQNTSYLFNGDEQNIIEGDPVPVLYGRLRVPGQPIAFESISGSRSLGNNGVVSSIALDTATTIVDVDSAAIYITPTGETTAISLMNSGGTSGGGSSSGVNESTGQLVQA